MKALKYALLGLIALGLIVYVIYGYLILTGPRM